MSCQCAVVEVVEVAEVVKVAEVAEVGISVDRALLSAEHPYEGKMEVRLISVGLCRKRRKRKGTYPMDLRQKQFS